VPLSHAALRRCTSTTMLPTASWIKLQSFGHFGTASRMTSSMTWPVANLPRQTRNVCDRSRDMQKFLRASMVLRKTLAALAPPLTHSACPSQGYPKLAERVSTPHVSSGSTKYVFFDGQLRQISHQKRIVDLGLSHRCVIGRHTGCCRESSILLLLRCLRRSQL
jgi:hypothetical protein